MTERDTGSAIIFQALNEIGIINQLSSTQLSRALAPYLGQSEFSVLNHFVRVGDATSPSRLARIFQMSKPSMTAILGKLLAKGHVTINASAEDKRRKIVKITKSGRAARDRGLESIAPYTHRMSAELDVDALRDILPTLVALRQFLDSARDVEDALKR